MARAFTPSANGYVAELDEGEARLLRSLFDDVAALLLSRKEAHAEAAQADVAGDAGTPAAPDAAADPAPTAPVEEPWWGALGLDEAEVFGGTGTRRLSAPDEPALARLLPDPVSGDDATAEEIERQRALVEPGIVDAKLAALREAGELVMTDPLRVAADAVPRFSAALNDVRLVLAERLGIHDAADSRRVEKLASKGPTRKGDPLEASMARLYSFISWLQETLMIATLRRPSR